MLWWPQCPQETRPALETRKEAVTSYTPHQTSGPCVWPLGTRAGRQGVESSPHCQPTVPKCRAALCPGQPRSPGTMPPRFLCQSGQYQGSPQRSPPALGWCQPPWCPESSPDPC